MFLADEQNCTAQRPLVTQIKGDSAEGERAVRVFLLPEKVGEMCGVRSASPSPSGPPQVQHTRAGVKSFVSRGLWWLRSLSRCWLCGFTGSSRELWCPHWAVFCRLGKGALGGFKHDVTAALLLTAVQSPVFSFTSNFTLVCYLRHFWKPSGTSQ